MTLPPSTARNAALASALATSLAGGPLRAQPARFQALGPIPGSTVSGVVALSADGTTALVGAGNGDSYLWTAATGMVPLGNPLFAPAAISADGSVVVGRAWVGQPVGYEAARWTQATGVVLEGSGSGGYTVESAAGPRAVSANGQVMVGSLGKPDALPRCPGFGFPCVGCPDLTQVRGFRQNNSGSGLQKLSPLNGYDNSASHGVSGDGSVIVGSSFNYCLGVYGSTVHQACMWTGGGQPSVIGPEYTEAVAISSDSSTVIGRGMFAASTFRWTASTGVAALGLGAALALSSDGGVIVGSSVHSGSGGEARIWDEASGVRDLRAVLVGLGLNLEGWTLDTAVGVSADGRTIAGNGINPAGHFEAWIAFLGDTVCYPDCTADGALTVADFGCFQTKFVAADPYADCNADGALTVADFGCFQTTFVTGCP